MAIVFSSSMVEKSNVHVVATGAPFVHVHVLFKALLPCLVGLSVLPIPIQSS